MTIFDPVDQILQEQNKTVFSSSEIKELCYDQFGSNKSSVIPSDYCYNRTNHGIGNDKNALIFLGSGEYKYVGRDFEYSGWVYHKEKGSKKEQIVGEWKKGIYYEFSHPVVSQDSTAESVSNIRGLTKTNLEKLYGDYLTLLELEINIFGFKATELRHLIGRIGEFKCAIETNGTLSLVTNQQGFDVISEQGNRISVKTTGQLSGFVSINANTLDKVDQLMVIQYKYNKFNIVYHGDIQKAVAVSRKWNNKFELDISKAIALQKV